MEPINHFDVTIILPIRNDEKLLKSLLMAINNQTLLPVNIIIVDSSTNDTAKKIVTEYNDTVPIVYHREKKCYPGKARNIGVELANGDWIAFLDSKTVPDKTWLERYLHLIKAYHAEVVFGVTLFDATSSFQKVLRATTYGKIGHHTVPGSLIKKKVFIDSGEFLEHVRMGEDIEWRERLIKSDLKVYRPNVPIVTYQGLPDKFFKTVKKYLTSTYHTARLNILRNVKDAYLTLLLILSAIILPKWNYYITGWDTNSLFIPHVTKIYLIAVVFLFLVYQFVHYLFFRNMSKNLFSRALQLIVLTFITLAVFNWNAVIAGWMEDAVFYVPHITKIYVSGVILASILYRGIILPLKRTVGIAYLLPFNWIKVSLLGLSLDLVKAPGYVVGSVIGLIKGIGIFRTKIINEGKY